MQQEQPLQDVQDLLDKICDRNGLSQQGPPSEQLHRIWTHYIAIATDLAQVKDASKRIERELNMQFDPELPLEQRTVHVLRRLADDRRKLLIAVAEALQTLTLVKEAEQQTSKSGGYWTHKDRKAISSLIENLCSSRLSSLSWVDASVARLSKLGESGGDF